MCDVDDVVIKEYPKVSFCLFICFILNEYE